MSFRLKIPDGMTLESLKQSVENGFTFHVFRYDIGIGFMSFERFSSAVLIPPGESMSAYNRPYNITTILIGWFCIPLGPLTAIKTILFNSKGGIDVTGDIMLNIDEESLARKHVVLEKTHDLFLKPDGFDIKTVKKVMWADYEGNEDIEELIFAEYINTVEPYYMLGLNVSEELQEEYTRRIRESFYKKFMKKTRIEFMYPNNDEEPEVFDLLRQQGAGILYRGHRVD